MALLYDYYLTIIICLKEKLYLILSVIVKIEINVSIDVESETHTPIKVYTKILFEKKAKCNIETIWGLLFSAHV